MTDDSFEVQQLKPVICDLKGLEMREIVTLQCTECKERNYSTTKNKKTTTGRLEFKKFCNRCRKHQPHKETK
jgi:large subunit ribosomal protein L33